MFKTTDYYQNKGYSDLFIKEITNTKRQMYIIRNVGITFKYMD